MYMRSPNVAARGHNKNCKLRGSKHVTKACTVKNSRMAAPKSPGCCRTSFVVELLLSNFSCRTSLVVELLLLSNFSCCRTSLLFKESTVKTRIAFLISRASRLIRHMAYSVTLPTHRSGCVMKSDFMYTRRCLGSRQVSVTPTTYPYLKPINRLGKDRGEGERKDPTRISNKIVLSISSKWCKLSTRIDSKDNILLCPWIV